MKRAEFEKIVDALAKDVLPFAIFPAVDDIAALYPHERGNAGAFIAWSKAADRALDQEKPFAFHFGGRHVRLAMAFAKAGIATRIDVEARSWDETKPAHIDARLLKAYGVVGTGVVAPVADEPDVIRIVRAFRAMRGDGIVALPCTAYTQSDGWSDVAEAQRSEKQTAVFWTEQGHESFDEVGKLSTICLYWRGDAARIAKHLRAEGFSVVEPSDENKAIEVSSARTAVDIPRFAQVLPDEARPATTSNAPKNGERAGSFEVLARGRSTDALPIKRLALHGDRLVIAHGYDQRGWPEAAAIVVDVNTGSVTRTFAKKSSGALTQSLAFLRDGRLALGVSNFVLPSECTPLGPATPKKSGSGRRVVARQPSPSRYTERLSAVVARLWDPSTDSESTLRIHGFSHGPTISIFSVTADAELAVVPSSEGALVFSMKTGDEIARIGAKPGAYPITAISPDGNAILWTRDGAGDVEVFARDGSLLFAADAPRAFFSVGFDPTSRYLVIGCRHYRGAAEERSIAIYALDGTRALPAVEAAAMGAQSIALNGDGSIFAVGRSDGVVRLIEIPSGASRGEGRVLEASITALSFASDGRLVAADEHGCYAVVGFGASTSPTWAFT